MHLPEKETIIMGLLNRKNWNRAQHWYTNGIRIAWWDRSIKSWTSYLIDAQNNQRTPAEYWPNRFQFEIAESDGYFSWDEDYETLKAAIRDNEYG